MRLKLNTLIGKNVTIRKKYCHYGDYEGEMLFGNSIIDTNTLSI